MPVEIRELLVRTTIESGDTKPGAGAPSAGAAGESTPAPAPSPKKNDNARAQERLLKECVNMIMYNLSSYSAER